ncbi:MAG TPA: hypothetical protein VNW92_21675, partial [Polyangiaceae bacterium]|nr:hypothetical protein [Polyangiaceae bacterium]
GAGGSAGKGGSSSGGGGAGGSAGKGGTGGGAGTGGSAGAGGGSAGTGGTTGGGTCDAAHSVATLATGTVYTGKANDCVRLSVNPTWATVAIQMQAMPGTVGYPVPFSFFSCAGNGTGSLTADYSSSVMKSGANPGCDYYVQFTGGTAIVKFTYYD